MLSVLLVLSLSFAANLANLANGVNVANTTSAGNLAPSSYLFSALLIIDFNGGKTSLVNQSFLCSHILFRGEG